MAPDHHAPHSTSTEKCTQELSQLKRIIGKTLRTFRKALGNSSKQNSAMGTYMMISDSASSEAPASLSNKLCMIVGHAAFERFPRESTWNSSESRPSSLRGPASISDISYSSRTPSPILPSGNEWSLHWSYADQANSSLAPLSPRLPVELQFYIISMIPTVCTRRRDKLAALSACALTYHAWVATSQHHLFSEVDLRECNWSRFVASLRMKPSNADHVRSMSIKGTSNRDPSWINSAFILLRSRAALRNLYSLSISGLDLTLCHPSFFATVSSFKTVQELKLYSILFNSVPQITRFLLLFPNTTNLSLVYCSARYDIPLKQHLVSPKRSRQIQLSHFDLSPETSAGCTFRTIDWLRLTSSPSNLISLNLTTCSIGTDTLSVSQLLHACGSSLRYLWLSSSYKRKASLDEGDNLALDQLSLSSNTNLQVLSLSYLIISDMEDISRLFNEMTSNQLISIRLTFRDTSLEHLWNPDHWKPLDIALAGNGLSTLETVVCYVVDAFDVVSNKYRRWGDLLPTLSLYTLDHMDGIAKFGPRRFD